ncbi:MAG TPA: ParB/RepB/Spo0J family partition protein [Candidatus Choladocola avistercoris]|nr:ParB/RepB/Spo0J family partition protein [Candidatus Choladocola avistercoris]
MAKRPALDMNLPTADDLLFSTQEERDNANREYVKDIPLDKISDFPNHPFKVQMDEKMREMIESIREHGVLSPALVRPSGDGTYEMVAGHRRKFASQMADRKDIPCIVRDLTDDEATILMVDSNLQREEILPSEKAFAYKMKLDAMKRQGKRTDLTSVPMEPKWRSNEELAKQSTDSVSQIKRYIRLTELIQPVLDMVDEKKIALRPAVELSYLSRDQQQILLDTMQMQDCTPSHAQAIKMRRFADEGRLNEDVILSIMSEEKGNQKEQFRIPRERIRKYFSPGASAKQMEDTIVKALELYRKRERDRER